MGAFYGLKIKNNETNILTGQKWKIEDVHPYWRPKVEKWLQDNQ